MVRVGCTFGVVLLFFWCGYAVFFGVVWWYFWCGVGVFLLWFRCVFGVVLLCFWCGFAVFFVWFCCIFGVVLSMWVFFLKNEKLFSLKHFSKNGELLTYGPFFIVFENE